MNNEDTQLTLIQRTLSLPGAQLNLRGLAIEETITERNLIKLGSHLGSVSGVLSWAWADYLVAMADRLCGGQDDSEKLATYCDEHAIPNKLRRELLLVARFYRAPDRVYPLPYEYYREAFLITRGNRRHALSALARAADDRPTLGQFRKALRTAEADTKPSAQSVFADYAVVPQFDRYAKAQLGDVEDYDAERARAILADLQHAVAFIDKLRALARADSEVETAESE